MKVEISISCKNGGCINICAENSNDCENLEIDNVYSFNNIQNVKTVLFLINSKEEINGIVFVQATEI